MGHYSKNGRGDQRNDSDEFYRIRPNSGVKPGSNTRSITLYNNLIIKYNN